jgi:type VI secretion system protein ImpE
MKAAADHFQAGNLQAAVAAALDHVRNNPADRAGRFGLAELLAFAGDLDRADKQLDVLGAKIETGDMMAVLMLRKVLRAETARREVFAEGRPPEFLTPPPPAVKCLLEALVRTRENNPAEAAKFLAEAEEARPRVAGTHNGTAFDDFRDLDDLTGPVLEVMTAHGKYYWVPLETIALLEFQPPALRCDLIWRRAKLVIRDGPDGDVFVPCLYPGAHAEADDAVKLGRKTDYRGGDGTPTRGVGLREFLVGEDVKPILELGKMEFTATKQG